MENSKTTELDINLYNQNIEPFTKEFLPVFFFRHLLTFPFKTRRRLNSYIKVMKSLRRLYDASISGLTSG